MQGPSLVEAALRRPIVSGVALAGLLEAFTCLLRFGFGLRAAEHMRLLTWPTFGVRIHHGYVGAALLIAALVAWGLEAAGHPAVRPWRCAFLAVGIALAASDAVHHFVVLKLVTGSAEFP